MTIQVELRRRGERKNFPKIPTEVYTIPDGRYNVEDLHDLIPSVLWNEIFHDNTHITVLPDSLNLQGRLRTKADLHVGPQIAILQGSEVDLILLGKSKMLSITEINWLGKKSDLFQLRIKNVESTQDVAK